MSANLDSHQRLAEPDRKNVVSLTNVGSLVRPRKVYRDGVSLYEIMVDGVSRDFKDEQIISEAAGSGFVIDAKLVRIVRYGFNVEMIEFFKKERTANEQAEGSGG